MKYSRFYQWYYKKHGIGLEDIENISVKDLPPISKELMMDHYDDLVCDRFLKRKNLEEFLSRSQEPREKYRDRYTVIHTSGSSGTISLFVYGPDDWAVVKAMVVARVLKPPPHLIRRMKLSFIGATDGHYAAVSLSSDVPPLLARFLPLPVTAPWKPLTKRVMLFSRMW